MNYFFLNIQSLKGLLGTPVQLLYIQCIYVVQCIYGCGPGQDNLLNFKLNVRMGKKAILSVAWMLLPGGPV